MTDLRYERINLGIRRRSQVFDAHRAGDSHLLRVGQLVSGCRCALVEGPLMQRHAKVLENWNRFEVVDKWDVGLVVRDCTHSGRNPHLNCTCLKEAMKMFHDPQDLKKMVYAWLDQHWGLQAHSRCRCSKHGKGGLTRTLVLMASSLRGLRSLSEPKNGWKEGWEEGSSCYGPRVELAEDNPKYPTG
jgi:hypothetical protein